MARGINIARIPGQSPNIQSMVVTAAQTFKKGALVIDVSAGTISECGADPSAVLGVAMEAAFTKPGNSMNFSPSYITGGAPTECSIAIADRRTVFSMRGVNGGTDPVTPTQTRVGESYGVAVNPDLLDRLDVAVCDDVISRTTGVVLGQVPRRGGDG